MKDYILKNIPEKLWREFHAKCAKAGKTMRQVLLELIKIYLK